MLVTNQSYINEIIVRNDLREINLKPSLRELFSGPVSLNEQPLIKYNDKIPMHHDKTMGPKINVKVAQY